MQSTKTQVSRRLTILCTEEIDSLFGMPHFTEGERQIHFELSPEARATIDAARTITAGVHLVLQLGYFRRCPELSCRLEPVVTKIMLPS